jgi:hypothetical protein
MDDYSYGYGVNEDPFSSMQEMVAEVARIQRNALFIGLGLGVVGGVAGGFVGRWAGGRRPLITVGSAIGGGLGLGFGGFFLSRHIMAANAAKRMGSIFQMPSAFSKQAAAQSFPSMPSSGFPSSGFPSTFPSSFP